VKKGMSSTFTVWGTLVRGGSELTTPPFVVMWEEIIEMRFSPWRSRRLEPKPLTSSRECMEVGLIVTRSAMSERGGGKCIIVI